jgi:group II intron reverse transcriptase/maturase
MTYEKKKLLSEENLRHSEYYGLQGVFDELYAKSKSGEEFTDLMPTILSRENILLAYRNIKTNTGSKTVGTDNLTIGSIGRLSPDEVVEKVRYAVKGSVHGYRPKPVRREEIPKSYDPTKTRPLGIPCIWDRLIQQCVKQVLEPICEAKFSDNSYGFRPNRSAEHAIAATYKHLQRSNLLYVIEFDIKGFFDNVNHSKLIRQIWAMGIRDKHLIYVLRQMLTAPIRLENGTQIIPGKGTPQGGIISTLLANIVLNELDHWVDSQWQNHPVTDKYSQGKQVNGGVNKHCGYRAMKGTKLKEMFIVRYADDFRIFCRTKTAAENTKTAITLNSRNTYLPYKEGTVSIQRYMRAQQIKAINRRPCGIPIYC